MDFIKRTFSYHKILFIRRCLKWFPSSHQETNILRFAPSFSRKVFYCFGVSHKFRTHSKRKIRSSRHRRNWCENFLLVYSYHIDPGVVLTPYEVYSFYFDSLIVFVRSCVSIVIVGEHGALQ